MQRRPVLSALVIAAGLAFAALAHAQWKWKDANGVVQYSDRPPPQGTPDRDVLQRPTPRNIPAPPPVAEAASAAASGAPAAPVAAAPKASGPADARARQAQEEAARKRAADEERVAKAKAENCERARAQLRTLDDGIRIARVNAKGEREILDDQGRAAEAKRMRDVVASDCKR